jgi:prophage DNA circulation protein
MPRQRWRDKLRPASFRGVRFLVDQVAVEGGRRGPDHEFPDREEPYAEDTGRKQRKWDFDGYLVGADYFAAKNKLITALEKKGSGDLIHPYYGKKKVVCRSFTVTETAGSGGFVKFSMKFVEAGQLLFPKAGSDRAFLVGLAGSLLGTAAATALTDAFSVADQAQFVVDSATDKLLAVTDRLESISAGITGAADPLAEFAFAVRNLAASVEDLVLSPVALASNIGDAFGLLFAAADPDIAFTSARTFFSFGDDDPTIPDTTATRTQQRANSAALNAYVKTVAVVGAANAAVEMSYKSVEDATAVRDALADTLDDLMETVTDDNLFSALQEMRAQVVNAVPGDTQNLAHISELILPATMPSLVLAYDLYGNVDDEQDLIDRNEVRHPAFIQGGKVLEVLDRE